MRLRGLSILSSCLALAACAGLGPHPYDRTGEPHATVTGTHAEAGADRVATFRVTGIDGWPVNSAPDPAKRINVDEANTLAVGRSVRVGVEGLLVFYNPMRSFFWDTGRVEGNVQFTPVDGARYQVRGEITPEGSTVWLEDERTHEVVGQKFAAAPKPAASVPDMRSMSPSP